MILVTGGAGYIGSHTVLELQQSGYEVLAYDNLRNSSVESLKRVSSITGKDITFVKGDIRDKQLLQRVFSENDIHAVVHFAGLKSVAESVAKPLEYYENNYCGSLILLQVMEQFGVKKLVFSSSATVYGDPASIPISEDFPTGQTTNPYGTSKYKVERMLQDVCLSDPEWSTIVLRYFNPAGAHCSGKIGENPNNTPNNLVPYISQVAIGKLPQLSVFGNDYPTKDGTGVRDYIHVVDLAQGHLAALNKLSSNVNFEAINIGTGIGYSVLEMITAFEQASGQSIPYKFVDRRPGDIAACYADTSYALETLGWKAVRSLQQMMEDTWRWQYKNPQGYGE